MSNGPIEYQLAASFDWETLVPVLFFVLYGIAQLLSAKKKGQEQGEEDQGVDDAAMEERARRIREEIRRKIEERRQSREGNAPQPSPAQYRGTEYKRYDPTLPEKQQKRPALKPRTLEPKPTRREVQPQPVPMESPQADIMQRLEEQRAVLEKSRREQREAKARAAEMMAAAGTRKKAASTRTIAMSGSLRGQLLAGLRDPISVRKAVLYREILDPPIGLR